MIVTGRLYTRLHHSLTSEDPEKERLALEGMLRYIEMAAELGAGIVLGWAKGNIRETASYLAENGFKSCFAHLDTFHMSIGEEDFPAAIRAAAPYLGYIHFADTTRWYPGSGYMDYKPILQTLADVGYDGYLTIECFPHENAKETAAKGLAYLKGVAALR